MASVADFDLVLKSQTVVKTRLEVERMIMLSLASEMLGLRLTPPSLVLEMMPFFVPNVFQWRRRVEGDSDLSSNVAGGC